MSAQDEVLNSWSPQADGSDRRGSGLGNFSDPRPLLLWDLNGVLLSRRSKPKEGSTKIWVRPGVEKLAHLRGRFQLGIFTSMTTRSLEAALAALREAGLDTDIFTVLLGNAYCQADYGSKSSCFKPLRALVRGQLDRVILLDDDVRRAFPGEEANMISLTSWKPSHGDDGQLERLCSLLLRTDAEEADARVYAGQVMAALRANTVSVSSNDGESECADYMRHYYADSLLNSDSEMAH